MFLSITLPAYAKDKTLSWTYDEDITGQEEWGGLFPSYAKCETGTQQSPVDIAYTTTLETMPLLDIRYRSSAVRVHFTDHTVEILISGNNTLMEGKENYRLQSIRFHSPAEHTIKGISYPLELQLLHENSAGKRLMVSILAEPGEVNSALQQVFEKTPNKPDADAALMLKIPALLPASHGYYAYTGSLTVPPCTEEIEWRVLKQPITVSKEQLSLIVKVLGRNARLIQPLYMRLMKETNETQ